MKILSWNVNGIQARLETISRLIREYEPDLLCLQKVRKKGTFITQIPGYMGWLGTMDDGLFGGVSTYVRNGFTCDIEAQRNDMSQWLLETNCINVLRFDRFIIVNTYFPYSNTNNEEWIQIRRQWDYELHDYLVKLSQEKSIIMCGDMNIVATEKDAWDGISVKNSGCFFPWEHKNFNAMMKAAGLVDSYRFLHPEGRDFSYFYQNKPDYRLRNHGFRIDYFMISQELMDDVMHCDILTDVVDTTNNPLILELNI